MKKIFLALGLLLIWASVGLAATAGTITQTLDTNFIESSRVSKVITFTCTASVDAATYPATALSTDNYNAVKGYYLYKIVTNPGSTAPTDNWDMTITDGDGIDVLGGAGANRHTTTSQMFAPLLTTGVYFAQPVIDNWTLNISGNAVNSAGIVIKAIFVK